MPHDTQALFNKIQALPPERIAEIEDFVDFIASRTRDLALTRGATAASVASFGKIWENPEDDAYDAIVEECRMTAQLLSAMGLLLDPVVLHQ